MINQYFRKRLHSFQFGSKFEAYIPESFRLFFSTHEPESITSLFMPEAYKFIGLGIWRGDQFFYYGDFLEDKEMVSQLSFDWEENVVKFQLLKIGYNEYSEGGIYIGTGAGNFGQIFFYKNSLYRAQEEEVFKMADSFEELMECSDVYGVQFDGSGSVYSKLEINLPDNIDELKLPWETPTVPTHPQPEQ